jgi:CheY-like chemotaxis protein
VLRGILEQSRLGRNGRWNSVVHRLAGTPLFYQPYPVNASWPIKFRDSLKNCSGEFMLQIDYPPDCEFSSQRAKFPYCDEAARTRRIWLMSILQMSSSCERMRSRQRRPDGVPYGILLVDDDEMVRTLLGLYFRQQGIALWLASDGEEAIELYQSLHEHIAVVLLDERMPILDGRATLARLQQQGAEAACYLMTEEPGAAAEAAARACGATGLLVKPFLFKVLARTVEQSLHDAQAMVDLNAIARFAWPYLRQVFGELVQHCSP